ncbi:biotin--[acetyl-CoA-carboxylase] ligase [Pseudahrensia aquimaris]|uniref:biotin--[biotin carboxyl-carrier protein] ligase n=1 Tax=Pseudahrensia aquimaris TaxID=744461 RepID=A0ABW3FMX1_9HYPH
MQGETYQSIDGLDGYRHLSLTSVGSTNVEAMERARAGDVGNLWITATEQITGKARRGRSWVSKPGNLYSSLLLIEPAEPVALASLPLVVSVALHDAVTTIAPLLRQQAAIKWPNDLLIGGKKTSGILLEAAQLSGGRQAVVIGCGINCRHFPDDSLYPATSLAAEGADIAPEQLFPVYAKALAQALDEWNRGSGLASIRQRWLQVCKGIGEPITARFPTHEISGTFHALDEDGQLVLVDSGGTEHRIAAADIFFGISNT